MGGNGGPASLAYIVIYVPDVNMAAEFYKKAFGLEIRDKIAVPGIIKFSYILVVYVYM
jgi:catechol 2,3-dioxygenase-like lactoylglutathione lyase family enzyme